MERVVIGLLAFFLGLTLIQEMAAHLWLALIFAVVAALVGRHLRGRDV
jgi:hypothetical protein